MDLTYRVLATDDRGGVFATRPAKMNLNLALFWVADRRDCDSSLNFRPKIPAYSSLLCI